MADAKRVWQEWQWLLAGYQEVFTQPGWGRFVEWVTGMVLCGEEHTVTQILVGVGLEKDWRSLEHFAEYGAWDRPAVEQTTMRQVEAQRPARWGRYHPVALDDTKLHRGSEKVWGVCTLHESTARSPNRAETVRVHNWVVLGDLVAGKPWTFLPHSARLYFRANQVPPGEAFAKKTALAVDLLRQADTVAETPILAVFDGAYAMTTVVRPCLQPPAGGRRIEVLTRLRLDARLYEAVTPKPGANGRPRQWGKRLPAPKDHGQWSGRWRKGQAYIYGRVRRFRWKRRECRWVVSGPKEPVHAYVFAVEGYRKPWFMVTTAVDLTAEQVVALFAARFRQEDGFRDLKQRLGMEECRAWTKEPILRTFQVQMVAMTLLRLMEFRLGEVAPTMTWWQPPPWNLRKDHPSVLDLRRLFWRYQGEFSQCLARPEDMRKVLPNPRKQGLLAKKAA